MSLKKKGYFLVSLHREENVDSDENIMNFMNTLEEIYKQYKMKYNSLLTCNNRVNFNKNII